MNKVSYFLFTIILIASCVSENQKLSDGKQSQIIKEMIQAVNNKDAEEYVKNFADNVVVYLESEPKVNGKEELQINRANHFKKYPQVYSEIQYLLEIDNKVIMHDKVWLNDTDGEGKDIVEIFTFDNGKISRVDVVQSKNLFR